MHLLTDQVFGHLYVVGLAGRRRRAILWLCRCGCGKELTYEGAELASGRKTSCGCATGFGTAWRKGLPEHVAWLAARARCRGYKEEHVRNYLDRGIRMAPEWDNFVTFLAYVGRRPSSKHTLERIDNDRGYEPGNVKWATRAEQSRNTRRTIRIEIDGRPMALKDAASGQTYDRAHQRLINGWTLRDALLVPQIDPRTRRPSTSTAFLADLAPGVAEAKEFNLIGAEMWLAKR